MSAKLILGLAAAGGGLYLYSRHKAKQFFEGLSKHCVLIDITGPEFGPLAESSLAEVTHEFDPPISGGDPQRAYSAQEQAAADEVSDAILAKMGIDCNSFDKIRMLDNDTRKPVTYTVDEFYAQMAQLYAALEAFGMWPIPMDQVGSAFGPPRR